MGPFILKINAWMWRNVQCVMNYEYQRLFAIFLSENRGGEEKKNPVETANSRAEEHWTRNPTLLLVLLLPPHPPSRYTQLIKAPVGGDISLCITGVTVCPLPGLASNVTHRPGG